MLLAVTLENRPRLSVSVPELAVVGEGDDRFVYTVDPRRHVHRTVVRTEAHLGGRVEIVAGLRPGQAVVTEGVGKVSDGLVVRLAGAHNARAAREPSSTGAPASPPTAAAGAGRGR